MEIFAIVILTLTTTARAESSRIVERTPQANPAWSNAELDALVNSESLPDAVDGYVAYDAVVALFADMTYLRPTKNGVQEIPFRLRQPKRIRKKTRYPLIVVFHGYGESDDDNKRQLSHLQYGLKSLAGYDAPNAFIVATQCPSGCATWQSSENRFGVAPIVYTLEIIDALLKKYPIDKTQIAGLGICSGANALQKLSAERPNFFRAQAFCGYSPTINSPNEYPIPTWSFNNKDDESAPSEKVRKVFDEARQTGARVFLTARESGSHDSWSYALRDCRIINWLAANATTRILPPEPGTVVHRKLTDVEGLGRIALPIFTIVAIYRTKSARALRQGRRKRKPNRLGKRPKETPNDAK